MPSKIPLFEVKDLSGFLPFDDRTAWQNLPIAAQKFIDDAISELPPIPGIDPLNEVYLFGRLAECYDLKRETASRYFRLLPEADREKLKVKVTMAIDDAADLGLKTGSAQSARKASLHVTLYKTRPTMIALMIAVMLHYQELNRSVPIGARVPGSYRI